MPRIDESTLSGYMDALASKAGTPGGGAAAGVTGGQACALIEMVCRLTRGNEARVARILAHASETRTRFLTLAGEDIVKFKAVMAAWRLRGAQREAALQPALEEAALVPLEMIDAAAGLIDDVEALAAIGNTNLVTDTGIAALLIEACIRSCRLNLLINLASITDETFIAQANARLSEALARLPSLTACNTAIDKTIAATMKEPPPSSSVD